MLIMVKCNEVVFFLSSFDLVMVNMTSDTLQAQIMVNILCMPGWIKTIGHQVCNRRWFEPMLSAIHKGAILYNLLYLYHIYVYP